MHSITRVFRVHLFKSWVLLEERGSERWIHDWIWEEFPEIWLKLMLDFWELVQSMKVGYFEKLGLLFQMDILLSVCGETTVGFFWIEFVACWKMMNVNWVWRIVQSIQLDCCRDIQFLCNLVFKLGNCIIIKMLNDGFLEVIMLALQRWLDIVLYILQVLGNWQRGLWMLLVSALALVLWQIVCCSLFRFCCLSM